MEEKSFLIGPHFWWISKHTLCCRVGEYIIVLYCEATNIQLRVHGVVVTLINVCALLLPLEFTWAVFTWSLMFIIPVKVHTVKILIITSAIRNKTKPFES